MRILHFISTLTGGGAERQLSYLAAELQRRGHEVLLVYANEGTGQWQNTELPVVKLAGRTPWDPRLIFRAVSLVRSFRPDVVHTWILQMDVVGGIAAAVTSTPWVLREPTSGVYYGRGLRSRLRIAVARSVARVVFANSPTGIEYWSHLAPRLRRELVTNGVALDEIDAVRAADIGQRSVGVYAGRLETLKNVDILLAAAAETMREHDFDLMIFGSGPDRARLEVMTRDLGIEARVRFCGYTEELWRHLKAAAFFASLSDYEGCPNTVLEAFASRVPTILSDIPAHRAIADDRSAFFAPLRDVSGTAAAIRRVLTDRESAAARAAAARARVETLSISSMTDRFERVYRELAEGRK